MRKTGIGIAVVSVLLTLIVCVGQIGDVRPTSTNEDVQIIALGDTAFASGNDTGVVVEGVASTTTVGASTDAAHSMGDVDGDGEITNKDLGLLQRHLNGWVVEIDTSVADVDGDGELTNKDLGLMQRYINGWDVEFVTTTTATTTTTTTTTTKTQPTTTTATRPPEPDTPEVSLPAAGYKPDNCIKVMSVSLSGQTVTMEIRNTSRVWETEDGKSYFEYTCYAENGNVLLVDKLLFGYIPTLTTKSYTFDIPEGTYKVVLTDFKAEYWSVPV